MMSPKTKRPALGRMQYEDILRGVDNQYPDAPHMSFLTIIQLFDYMLFINNIPTFADRSSLQKYLYSFSQTTYNNSAHKLNNVWDTTHNALYYNVHKTTDYYKNIYKLKQPSANPIPIYYTFRSILMNMMSFGLMAKNPHNGMPYILSTNQYIDHVMYAKDFEYTKKMNCWHRYDIMLHSVFLIIG